MIPLSSAAAVRTDADRYPESVAQEFDAHYYYACYPDVCEAGVDALEHFMEIGWREGRNPSHNFDVSYYLAINADVVAAGINPYAHYIQAGRSEGRSPRRPLHMWRRQIEAAKPSRDSRKGWNGVVDRSAALPLEEMAVKMRECARGAGLAISVSHDDYGKNYGGVQNIIADEERLFTRSGWRYLHVSPAQPLPTLAEISSLPDSRLKVRLDGDVLGIVTAQTLVTALEEWPTDGPAIELVVHHLLGHAPEVIAAIAHASRTRRPKVWLHDFFTLCPSYTLMRNNVTFCSAPPPDSGACNICVYGEARSSHSDRMRQFFGELVPDVAAPSKGALDFWTDRSSYSVNSRRVIAPASVLLAPITERRVVSYRSRRLVTVAHVGARAFHKGWAVFEELALHFCKDPRFRFLQLGAAEGVPLPSFIKNIPVKVSALNRHAMTEAVAEQNVDIVICWSLWPETFCFTVHEALAGGAFVVARADSGNVWPAVSSIAPRQGVALKDVGSVVEFFEGNGLEQLLNNGKRMRGAVVVGEHSYGWVQDLTEGHAHAHYDASSEGRLHG
jgi:hypothetical protein